MQPSITAIVLTLNEQHVIRRALKSVQWCNDVIVVDSGSNDLTQNLCEASGARFFVHKQPGQFLITEQRNWALLHTSISTDWVLFLDADEEISPDLASAIISILQSNPSHSAFELAPRYWFLGKWLKHTQGFPNWHPRLLRHRHARFTGGVWESFDTSGSIGRIYTPYEHYAFAKGLDDWIDRHQRYSTWDATCIHNSSSLYNRTLSSSLVLRLSTKLWYLRPFGRFFQKYILNLGFLDGPKGLLFAILMTIYEFFVLIKVVQYKRESQSLPL